MVRLRRFLFAAVGLTACLLLPLAVSAQTKPVDSYVIPGNNYPAGTNGCPSTNNCFVPFSSSVPLSTGAAKHFVSSTLTRIANSTAYTGTTTSPQAVCLFTSVTICAPVTLAFTSTGAVNGYVTSLRLEKSTTGATGATFAVLLYQAAPTLTGIFDASVYTPKAADITSGALVGYWTCSTQVVNGDNGSYECTSTTNSGNQAFSTANGTLYGVIETTGSYAPGSGETFSVIADVLASAP